MNYNKNKNTLMSILNTPPYVYPINKVAKKMNIRVKEADDLVDYINDNEEKIVKIDLPSKFIKIMRNQGSKILYGNSMIYYSKNESEAIKHIANQVPKKENRVKVLNSLNAHVDKEIYNQIRKYSLTGLEQKFIEEASKNGETNCAEIAKIIGIPFTSATRLATNLEDMGYIVKNRKRRKRRSPYTIKVIKTIDS